MQQSLETEFRKHVVNGVETKLTKDEATDILRKSMELVIYHDCLAHNEVGRLSSPFLLPGDIFLLLLTSRCFCFQFEIGIVTANDSTVLPPEEVVGNWAMAETNCNYE